MNYRDTLDRPRSALCGYCVRWLLGSQAYLKSCYSSSDCAKILPDWSIDVDVLGQLRCDAKPCHGDLP